MWARGMERRTMTVRFERPPGTSWSVATQLHAGRTPFSFSAPNLQYLMDSPAEFSQFSMRTFTVPDENRTPVFRLAAHHTGTDAELDALVRDTQAIVREAKHVFREYPPFEGNTYTFIADYLPWANGDGMEHRNSTILTSSSSIRTSRLDSAQDDRARVLPLVERRTHPPAIARAIQSGRREHVGRAVAGGRRHQLLRPADPEADRSHHRARVRPGHGRGDRRGRQQPGPVDPQRRGDESDGAVRRSGVARRPDELLQHVHLVLHVGLR